MSSSFTPHAEAVRDLTAPAYSPPRGRFSHLSMFRLGSLLFIPSYLTVILYRVFASPSDDGNLVLMAGKSPLAAHIGSVMSTK